MDSIMNALRIYAQNAFETEQYESAARYYELIVEHDPGSWSDRLQLARCLFKSDKHAATRDELTYIVEHCPTYDIRRAALNLLKEEIYAEQDLEPVRVSISEFGIAHPGDS
jgi:hypothetical protein